MISKFLYFGIIVIPNSMLFKIKVIEGFHLTPVRLLLLVLFIILLLQTAVRKVNFNILLGSFDLIKYLFLLLIVKTFTILYTTNIFIGIRSIEWYLEAISLAIIYCYYYKRGTIHLSMIKRCLLIGLGISLTASLLQINSLLDTLQFVPDLYYKYFHWVAGTIDQTRVIGLFSLDPNNYSYYLVSIIIMLFFIILHDKELRGVNLIAISISIIVLYSTQSRSGIAIFILISVYIFYKEKIYLSSRKLISGITIIIGICFIVSIFLNKFIMDNQINNYSKRYNRFLISIKNNRIDKSLRSHIDLRMLYPDLIVKKPLYIISGAGEGDYLYETIGRRDVSTAHDGYLLILAENGLIGLLIFLIVSWKLLKTTYFVYNRTSNNMAKSYYFISIIYLITTFLYGSTIWNHFFWLIIGLSFGEKYLIKKENKLSLKLMPESLG